jgi:hypothetical protein
MSTKSLLLALLVCALFAVKAEAATVSFLIVETGLSADAGMNPHSGLWESGLLDVFFEAGHIVSNAPVMRLYGPPAGDFPEEAQKELDEALEGGVEYFIIALLDYDASDSPRPRNISLRVFATNPRKMLYEQRYTDKSSMTLKDEYDNLKKVARSLISHLN